MNQFDDLVARLRKASMSECTCNATCCCDCMCGGAMWRDRYSDDSADTIERLSTEVDRWKSLCERVMDYQLGSSDWQDIRIAYDLLLEDYNAQRSS